jgi:peptide/nickel transport system permease protein
LLLTIPTMFVVATFTFFLIQLVPGDPANFMLGQGATLEQVEVIHHELGLDKPLLTQYVDWLSGVLRGDLGRSFITNETVTAQLSAAVPATLSLAALATGAAFILGLAGGIVAGLRGGRIDRFVQAFASIGLGVPNFWLAVLLVYIFAILWPIFPATGFTPLSVSPRQWIIGLILPVTAIAVNNTAQIMFQARSSVLEVISSDFVRTLQATGLSRRRIVLKHVLRNASIPVVTVAGFVFVVTLGGVVVIEVIFNILGVGRVFLNAVNQHDLPIVQGAILYFTLAVMIVNLLVDLLVAWLDPRIRLT